MNNVSKNLRILPVIGITLTLIGYLFLTFQTYKLNERKNILRNEIEVLEMIKARLTNDAKENHTIITIQDSIISQSSDEATVKKGEELKEKIANPSGTHFSVTKNEEANIKKALSFEMDGFNYLLEKDVDNAIASFRKSENSFNSFHQVYEIAIYLEKNKSSLADKDSKSWNEAYVKVLKDYSWRMPEDIKVKLIEVVST